LQEQGLRRAKWLSVLGYLPNHFSGHKNPAETLVQGWLFDGWLVKREFPITDSPRDLRRRFRLFVSHKLVYVHALASGHARRLRGPLSGEVEVDETYVGGKNKNRHFSKKVDGRGPSGKVAVIGAIARKGMVVARVIENTSKATLDSSCAARLPTTFL